MNRNILFRIAAGICSVTFFFTSVIFLLTWSIYSVISVVGLFYAFQFLMIAVRGRAVQHAVLNPFFPRIDHELLKLFIIAIGIFVPGAIVVALCGVFIFGT